MYNIVYNDRDPTDAVAFTKYIHNKKIKAVCNKKKKQYTPRQAAALDETK